MQFIPNPICDKSQLQRFKTQQQIKEDISMTTRKPYLHKHEIGLPLHNMK